MKRRGLYDEDLRGPEVRAHKGDHQEKKIWEKKNLHVSKIHMGIEFVEQKEGAESVEEGCCSGKK